MVMAPRAADRQPKKHLSGRVDIIRQLLNAIQILDLKQHVAIRADR